METKTCTKCGETKPSRSFTRDKRKRDGLRPWCRECCSAYSTDRYAANVDKERARAAAYRAANPGACRASSAAWRAANPDKVKAQQSRRAANVDKERARAAAYRAANPDKVKERNRIPRPKKAEDARNLVPYYVAAALHIPVAQVTPELLELKREQLTLKRLARELKKAANESINNDS